MSNADLRLLTTALDAAPAGVIITDGKQPDHPIIYTSGSFLKLTGYSESEVLGRNCRMLQGPDTDPDARAKLRKATKSGLPVQCEILNYRKSGEPFWNQVCLQPLCDENGELTHFVGTQTDITARKEIEDRLRRQTSLLEEAQRVAHLGNWEWDISSNNLHWSNELCRIYGFEPSKINIVDHLVPTTIQSPDREAVQKAVDLAFHTGFRTVRDTALAAK